MTIAIFDTNAYRRFTFGKSLDKSRDKAVSLREAEGRSKYQSLAHPIVIWELLTHLADPADEDYNACLNALVALGVHAASREEPRDAVCMIADAFATVCRALFNRLPSGYEEGLKNLGSLVTHIVKNAPDLSDPVAQRNIQDLAQGMAKKEQGWLSGMEGIVTQFSPEAAGRVFGGATDEEALRKARDFFASEMFFQLWAQYVVMTNGAEVGISSLPPDELRIKAEAIRNLFPVPFRLLSALLQKLATKTPPDLAHPKRKRWNFIWDSMISFSVGPGTILEAPVFMITGDREIAQAAKSAGFEDQIIPLDTYLTAVGFR